MSFFELSILDCCVLISIISFAMLRFAPVVVVFKFTLDRLVLSKLVWCILWVNLCLIAEFLFDMDICSLVALGRFFTCISCAQ